MSFVKRLESKLTIPLGLQNKGTVFSIQKYSVHDGPGIRTIIFMKGCNLACRWCSNPESQASYPQLAYNPEKCLTVEACPRCREVCPKNALSVDEYGKVKVDFRSCDNCLKCAQACPNLALNPYGYKITVEQALKRVEEDDLFYARSGGGLTLSGGEPLFQGVFAIDLLREARKRRIDTCVETCGHVPWLVLKEAAQYLNTVYYDIKCLDRARHLEWTGVPNDHIKSNLVKLRAEYPGLPIRVRTPVIPGFNDDEESISSIIDFIHGINEIDYELLAYHRMGTPKYGYLGRDYPLPEAETVTEGRLKELRQFAGLRLKGFCQPPPQAESADQDEKSKNQRGTKS
ncbi:MAG: glycyl-radical enzyme activating protein [Deltaproteobacteria bacterium]|nr:glycyl-radical enzyme activating protein [Deltaproteobacteria bacterium]